MLFVRTLAVFKEVSLSKLIKQLEQKNKSLPSTKRCAGLKTPIIKFEDRIKEQRFEETLSISYYLDS